MIPELKASAEELKRLIEFHGYRSDLKMAGFLSRKSDQIKQLIPYNRAYEKQIQFFQEGIQQAERILSGQ